MRADQVAAGRQPDGVRAKPTPAELGVDLASLDWQRSGTEPGAFEVAFVAVGRRGEPGTDGQDGQSAGVDWVLLRVTGDPDGRVLVYDRTEWTCFIDGAEHGEFDLETPLTPVAGADPGRSV